MGEEVDQTHRHDEQARSPNATRWGPGPFVNTATHAGVELDDGSFFVPVEFLDAIREEKEARGSLTVAQAASLCEKWAKAAER